MYIILYIFVFFINILLGDVVSKKNVLKIKKIYFNKINFNNINNINKNKKKYIYIKKNKYKINKKLNKCKLNITIDAGHGGFDPGALGYYGSKEKDINLIIAKKLLNLININSKFNVYLTRNDDKYLSLKKRLNIIKNNKTNLFLSIHTDSFKYKYVYGPSIWIFRKFNNKLLNINYNKNNKDHKNSFTLANEIINIFKKFIGLNKYKCIPQYSNLAILSLINIPSVLIEIGYISNPKEEKKLINNIYQNKLVKYIYLGLNNFINKIC